MANLPAPQSTTTYAPERITTPSASLPVHLGLLVLTGGFGLAVVGTLVPDLVSQIPLRVRFILLVVLAASLIGWVVKFYTAWIIAIWRRIREYNRTYSAWEVHDTELRQLREQQSTQIQLYADEVAKLTSQRDDLLGHRAAREDETTEQMKHWSYVFEFLLRNAPRAAFLVLSDGHGRDGLAIEKRHLPDGVVNAHILVVNRVTFKLLGLFTIAGHYKDYFTCRSLTVVDQNWWDHVLEQARLQTNIDSQAVAVLLVPPREA